MALVGSPLPNPLYHCPRKHTFNVSWKECLKQTQGSYVDPVCFRHSFYCDPYLYFNQFVFLISKTDFYAVFYCGFPVGIRVNVCKVVVVPAAVLFQNASCNNRLAVDGVHTGHIEGHRIEGGEHADIGNNRDIVLGVAVTVW